MRRKSRTSAVILVTVAALGLCFCSGCKKEEGNVSPGEITVTPDAETTGGMQAPEQNSGDYEAYSEAPSLQTMVAARKLPAAEKRLPLRKDVYTVTEFAVGAYGDDVQFAAETAEPMAGELLTEGLFRYGENGTVAPNVAKGYTVNSDFTKYTISLREGLRWSDGALFTSDDCIFFYEKLCLPEAFGEALWECFTTVSASGKKENAVFKKLDAYSFEVIFSNSKPEFLAQLLEQGGICFAPEHCFVNLMPESMGTDAAKAKATDMGYSDIAAMLRETVKNAWNIPGVPTVNAFCISGEEGTNDVNGNYYEYVRNPYYWKVDEEGKQLPYMDRLGVTRISGESQKMLLTTEGFLTVSELTKEQVAEAKAGAERGDYQVVTWTDETSYAVKNLLKNFPENCPYEEGVRGLGAAHAETWYVK